MLDSVSEGHHGICCYFVVEKELFQRLHRLVATARAAGLQPPSLDLHLAESIREYMAKLSLADPTLANSVEFIHLDELGVDERAYFDGVSRGDGQLSAALPANLTRDIVTLVGEIHKDKVEEVIRKHFTERSNNTALSAEETAEIAMFLADKQLSLESLRDIQDAIEADILVGVAHNRHGDIKLAMRYIDEHAVPLDDLVRIQRDLEFGGEVKTTEFIAMPRMKIKLLPTSSPLARVRDLLHDQKDKNGKPQWENLKLKVRNRFAHPEGADRAPCECCGKPPQDMGFSKAEVVEQWDFEESKDGKNVQKLVSMALLCPMCSMVYHLSQREFSGTRQSDVIKHIQRVNDFTLQDANHFMQNLLSEQERMSQLTWEVDISLLVNEEYAECGFKLDALGAVVAEKRT